MFIFRIKSSPYLVKSAGKLTMCQGEKGLNRYNNINTLSRELTQSVLHELVTNFSMRAIRKLYLSVHGRIIYWKYYLIDKTCLFHCMYMHIQGNTCLTNSLNDQKVDLAIS